MTRNRFDMPELSVLHARQKLRGLLALAGAPDPRLLDTVEPPDLVADPH